MLPLLHKLLSAYLERAWAIHAHLDLVAIDPYADRDLFPSVLDHYALTGAT
jgi:hypothetical protein